MTIPFLLLPLCQSFYLFVDFFQKEKEKTPVPDEPVEEGSEEFSTTSPESDQEKVMIRTFKGALTAHIEDRNEERAKQQKETMKLVQRERSKMSAQTEKEVNKTYQRYARSQAYEMAKMESRYDDMIDAEKDKAEAAAAPVSTIIPLSITWLSFSLK